VSGYGLDDQAIEVRSPAEPKVFFLQPLCPDCVFPQVPDKENISLCHCNWFQLPLLYEEEVRNKPELKSQIKF
jgi:hypothetical protein